MMQAQSYSAILLCLALLVTGCAELTTTVISQFQPSPTPTVDPVGRAPVSETQAVTPTPTPVGGGGTAPLLFISNRGSDDATDIYQINPDGSGLGRITNDPATESHPRWSPGRRQIAFVSDRSGLNQVYLLSVADYQVTQLTDHPAGATGPTWSPDGTQLAFVEPDPAADVIMIVDTETGAEVSRHVVNRPGLANLAWSPQDQVIVFSALVDDQAENRDIFSFNLEDDVLINLTNQPGNDDQPAWSPNGERLTFQSDRDGDLDIYVMQANGTLQTPLTLNTTVDVEPHWSADGLLIAFSSNRDGPFHLYVMSENGADAQVVAPLEADDRQPRWPPRVRSTMIK
jgi:TolB protein